MDRSRIFVMCIMVLVVLVSPTLFAQQQGGTSVVSSEIATVIWVHDGDTFTVEFPDGRIKSVRLIGIDTPEFKSSYCPYTQPYAWPSQAYAATIMDGKCVRLERDVRDRDRYGRLLRHVYVLQDDGAELYANEAIVVAGFARADPVYPDLRNAERFAVLERDAHKAHVGRWKAKVRRQKKTALRSSWSEHFFLFLFDKNGFFCYIK